MILLNVAYIVESIGFFGVCYIREIEKGDRLIAIQLQIHFGSLQHVMS